MKVTPELASRIRAARAFGVPLKEIARVTELSLPTVQQTCQGRIHKNAPVLEFEAEAFEYKAKGLRRAGEILHEIKGAIDP